MDEKVNPNSHFSCNICNKYYSSKSSLCNHNKKFHNNILPQNTTKNVNLTTNIPQNLKLICNFCNKHFSRVDSKNRHEKNCKTKINDNTKEMELIKLEQLKEQARIKKDEIRLKKEEAAILRLKLKLQNSDKIDNITLRKLNKLLLAHNTRIKNSTVNSHNTNIQNNITNNFQLIGFGKEDDLHQVLTHKEKKMILNSHYASLEKLIKIVHCGKYNQFKNIIITNMKDNYMYKYDLHPIEFA